MFTGLVEEMGTVAAPPVAENQYKLCIRARITIEDLKIGDSVAVEGVCLTVVSHDADSFTCGLAPETLRLTTLGDLVAGDAVNLERAALPTTRLGGHYVQGHVDGVGTLISRVPDGHAEILRIAAPVDLLRYIVRKGYVAVDGASLTVIEAGTDYFTLTLIPHSRAALTLGTKRAGARVNLEVDILAKYAEKLLTNRSSS